VADHIVEVRGLWKSFDTVEVLRGVSFTLSKGETLVIMGGSGSGKTVMLRLVAGLIGPDAGTIRVFGRNIEHLSEEELLPIRRRLGYVFQAAALFDSLSVRENVAYPLREHTRLDELEARRGADRGAPRGRVRHRDRRDARPRAREDGGRPRRGADRRALRRARPGRRGARVGPPGGAGLPGRRGEVRRTDE